MPGEEVAGCAHDHRREQDQCDEVRERHQSVEDVGNAPHHRDGEVGSDRDDGDVEEPVVSNLALSGIHGDTIQTCATTKGWIEAPLDYPSHLSEDPAKYASEKNTAMIPTEVMEGPGYDWHFKLAVMLRQGRVYDAGIEKFKPGRKHVILLGDETASACAADYGADWQVFDMGFPGDKVQNVMWRVIQGTLAGYRPDRIVISVGKHNKGANTEAEIAAAQAKLIGLVRARAPQVELVVK